jgi:hypothetical protein
MPIAPRKEAMLIYFDETDIHWCPDTGKGYQIVGIQEKIDSPGQDQVRYLMGGIAYPTSEGLYQIYDRKRTLEVESYLDSLVEMFSEPFIFLIWDNAKTHTTEMLEPFFNQYKESICPVFLPTYSPRLNLIERLWRQMRADMTRNHFAESIKETCEAVVNWLEKLPFARFMSLMGLDSAAEIS